MLHSVEAAGRSVRNLDWDGFIRGHDYRYGPLLHGMAEGRTLRDSAERCGETEWSIYHLQRRMARELRAYLGPDAMGDAVSTPLWESSRAA